MNTESVRFQFYVICYSFGPHFKVKCLSKTKYDFKWFTITVQGIQNIVVVIISEYIDM